MLHKQGIVFQTPTLLCVTDNLYFQLRRRVGSVIMKSSVSFTKAGTQVKLCVRIERKCSFIPTIPVIALFSCVILLCQSISTYAELFKNYSCQTKHEYFRKMETGQWLSRAVKPLPMSSSDTPSSDDVTYLQETIMTPLSMRFVGKL